ncbi:MAG: EpsI family protein [Gemmatimonadota bacterium]|nr:EpsI family protein [Gemmatimonadota bacterium]
MTRERSPNAWRTAFAPSAVLLIGALGSLAVQPQRRLALEAPLENFPNQVAAFSVARTLDVPEPERQALQADDLLHREYRDSSGRTLTVYVAYYGRQGGGYSIHSPTNCLPGSGWEPVESDRVTATTRYGPSQINRYLIEHGTGAQALVYYWYQGRGRVAASEYRVKTDLLRDAILARRTDEALVRVVFPLAGPEDSLEEVDALAAATVARVVDALDAHLPG